jgi:hypothetical protein
LLLFPIIIARRLAYRAIREPAHLIDYQKLEVTKLATMATSSFVISIFFFLFLYIFTIIDLALANIRTETLTASHLFHFDIFFLYPYGVGPNAASFLSYYLTMPQWWDSFHQQILMTLFYAEWVAPVGALLYVILTIRHLGLFNVRLWDPDLQPDSIHHITRKTSGNVIHIAILLEWLIISAIKFMSVGIIIVGFLTVFHITFLEWAPTPLLLPFVWFEASFQVVLGTLAGTIIARIVLTLIFLPVVLWLLMWFSSLCSTLYKSIYYLRFRNKNAREIQSSLRPLCQHLHIPTPLICLEDTKDGFPVTIPLFLRHCVIAIPPAFIDATKSKELQLILAHELGHVAKHSAKMWQAQVLSCLTLNGVGYLTLLLNYWKMEIEADEYALLVTKDVKGFISILERLESLADIVSDLPHDDSSIGALQGNVTIVEDIMPDLPHDDSGLDDKKDREKVNKIVEQATYAYNIYFAINLWGGAHPHPQERIDHLHIFNRLSKEAQRVIEYAKEEAKDLQHASLGIEHLLLGLFREFDLPLDKTRSVIALSIGRGESPAPSQVNFNSDAMRVLAQAANEADVLNFQIIRAEHLWLGLFHEQGTIAVTLLEDFGIDLEKRRATLLADLLESKSKKWEHSSENASLSASEETDETKQGEKEESNSLSSTRDSIERPYVLEGLTGQTKNVIQYAREEARRFQHNYVGTEHLLLGLLRESDGIAANVLARLGVELNKIRSAVEFIIGRGERIVSGDIGLTPHAKTIIGFAVDEALSLKHRYVGTEHLLIGIVREGEGIAAGILESLGINLEKVRTVTIKTLEQQVTKSQEEVHENRAPQMSFSNREETDAKKPVEKEETSQQPPSSSTTEKRSTFDKFTQQTKKVLTLAQEEALHFQHNYVGTEHLLLGLVGEGEGVAAQVLTNFGVELNTVRSAFEFIIGHGDHIVLSEFSLSRRAKKVIELAVDEAARLKDDYIGTEHLLLGLLRESDGIGASLLESLGINLEQVRTALIETLMQQETRKQEHVHDETTSQVLLQNEEVVDETNPSELEELAQQPAPTDEDRPSN